MLSKDEITNWLTLHFAVMIGEDSETIDIQTPIDDFDIDSIDAVTTALEMEQAFDVRVSPEPFLKGDVSIAEVANRIILENQES